MNPLSSITKGALASFVLIASSFVAEIAPVYAEPFAHSGASVRTRGSIRNFPNAPILDDTTVRDIDSNTTGEFVSSRISRVAFSSAGGSGGVQGVELWARGEAFGEADLAQGTLRSYSSALGSDTFRDPNEPNDGARATASHAAAIGDSFTTTTRGGAPFIWNGGVLGHFRMNVTGLLRKEHVLLPGQTKWGVHLQLTTPDGDQAFFDWSYGIGVRAMTSVNPYGIGISEAAFGDACIVCEARSQVDFPDPLTSTTWFGDFLFADFDIGTWDFDWVLTLTTLADASSGAFAGVDDKTGTVTSDFSNTLNLSYQGPPGSVTSANVFSAIVPAPVPIPASIYFLGAGLLSFWRLRR